MRHGQSDETHRAAEGGDGAREQDRGEEDQRARALHVESHRAGIVLAQQQQVERLDDGDGERQSRGDDGKQQRELAARDVAQRPHGPDDERFERRLARQVLEDFDHRTDARTEHHAEDEDDHDVLDAAADRHHDGQHERRAEPRSPRPRPATGRTSVPRRPAGGAQQEQRDAESCARADAQHVGTGQRVAEKGLHFESAGSEGPRRQNRAVMAFRSLILRMMSLVAGSQEPPVSAAQTSPNGTATDPTARSAMKALR